MRVKTAGQTVDVWGDGVQKITSQTVTGTTYADGGVTENVAAAWAWRPIRQVRVAWAGRLRLCGVALGETGVAIMSLMMGVSGVRGIVGETMTVQLAGELGCAFGSELGGGTVVVGRDSRPSGEMVQQAYVAGLLSTGCDVVELGVVSTPGTAMMVRRLGAAGGTVITASHNPVAWNGIKFLTPEGLAPPPARAEALYERWRQKAFTRADVHGVGKRTVDDSTHEHHVAAVLAVSDVDRIKARRLVVVLDSVNGAGGPAGRQLLEGLGCTVVHINAAATGWFAHTPEPTAENLTELCAGVRERGAAIGLAQDPDADRLAVVDETGRYIGEEYTLALAARHVFATRPGPAATNLSTSRMIDDLAAAAGPPCVVHRTAVGEANVVDVMNARGCVIGGEGNGGVVDPRVVPVRDSLAAMALVLELLAGADEPLSAVVDAMPRYAMIKEKMAVDREQIARVLTAVGKHFADQRINDIDGVRIDWDEGWVHVRGSNTEPILRIIAEGKDAAAANELIRRVRSVAAPLLLRRT